MLRWVTRGLLFFSGVMFTTLLSKSMSVHFSCQISPHLAPVSLSSCRNVAMRLLHACDELVDFGFFWDEGNFADGFVDWWLPIVPPTIFRKDE